MSINLLKKLFKKSKKISPQSNNLILELVQEYKNEIYKKQVLNLTKNINSKNNYYF